MMKKEMIQVVLRAQAQDQKAFECLYTEYYKQAYATAYKYCGNDADAKDVVQDSFIAIQNALPSLKHPELFDFWMTRVIHSKSLNMFRKNRVIYMDNEQLQVLPDKNETHKEYLPDQNSAEEEEKKLMKTFVHKLTPGQQECIELFYFEQMSLKEVSTALKISVGTVKSRLFSARKALKNYIEHYEQSEDVKVSFKAGTALSAFMIVLFKKGISKLSVLKDQVIANSATMNAATLINVTTMALTATVVAYGGTQAYQVIANEIQARNNPPTSLNLPAFPTITYKDKAYSSPKSMYYALLLWIEKPIIEEFAIMEKMYNVIKEENGIYWNKLVKGKWSEKFENHKIKLFLY